MTTTPPAQVVPLPLPPAVGPDGLVDLTATLQLHDSFRADLARVEALIARTPAADRHTYAVLVRRWWTFREAWNRHHVSDSFGVWPLLRQRVPELHGDDHQTLDAMAIEHETISSLLGQCSSWVERLAARGDERDRARLLSRTSSLRMLLNHHMEHEEAEALPLVQRHLTPAEWDRLQREHVGDGPAPGDPLAPVFHLAAVTR